MNRAATGALPKDMTHPTRLPVTVNGVTRWLPATTGNTPVPALREAMGSVLRGTRTAQRRTLRDVSASATVSLGYLSEVERGRKEASSELIATVCASLDMPVSILLREVADLMALAEGNTVPDTIPEQYATEPAYL